ncbi:uncharacterized protein [Clytia hemisphaerica]|uniref:Uncharacterized protein n=1 Tax=Clytia hemisphaerica TaxID=252671 RepID=A0A7M5V0Y5_9CNID
MNCDCTIITNFVDGYAAKSPPVEKLRRGYSFKKRYYTLGLVDICMKCCRNLESLGRKLVFSYYIDETQQQLKGRFEVENSKLERVYEIEELPKSCFDRKYILKWTMKTYDRVLYLIWDDEGEGKQLLNVFKDYRENRRRSRSRQSSDTSEASSHGGSSRHSSNGSR